MISQKKPDKLQTMKEKVRKKQLMEIQTAELHKNEQYDTAVQGLMTSTTYSGVPNKHVVTLIYF